MNRLEIVLSTVPRVVATTEAARGTPLPSPDHLVCVLRLGPQRRDPSRTARCVERTFAWLEVHRRLVRDYGILPETSETVVQVAMIRLMLARIDSFRTS